MLNGTEIIRLFLPVGPCGRDMQGAFPENGVRHVYFSRVNGAFFAQNMFAHGKF